MNRITRVVVLISLLSVFTSFACATVTQFLTDADQEPPALNEASPLVSPEESSSQPEQSAPADHESEEVEQTAIGDGLVPPPESNGVCDNIFYPLVPGNQWVYEVTSEGETNQIGLTVTEIVENQAKLNALYLETGITTEITADCLDGAIINYPILLLGFLFGDVDGEMTLQHKEGVFMPNYETFVSHNWDYNWISKYSSSGEVEAVVDGDLVTGILEESPLDLAWNTLGAGEAIFEGVTVKAGEFPQAIKLDREAKFNFTAQVVEEGQSVSLSAVLILHTNIWYEPNMGMVKQEVERADVKLFGVSFPITMEGVVELVEFRTGE